MTDATPFLPGLSPVAGKALTAAQDAGNLSSNGGLVVLREIARKLDLAQVIAGPLVDSRDPTRVLHTYAHMVARKLASEVTARMMAIAAGHEDCDDLDALREDPALKIACERAPESGAGIASQPTLSRLENLPDRRTLVEIGLGFIDLFCRSWSKPPERITLDIDDTDDPAHGQQELAMFNTHAGTTCFKAPDLIRGADLRGGFGQAGVCHDAAGQAAERQGDRARPAPRHRSHSHALAEGENPGARRQPLLRAPSARSARKPRLRLHSGPFGQCASGGDGGTLEGRGRGPPSAPALAGAGRAPLPSAAVRCR